MSEERRENREERREERREKREKTPFRGQLEQMETANEQDNEKTIRQFNSLA
jgi:hypothetical protein